MSTRNIYKGFPNRVSDNIRIRAGWLARSGCIPNMEAEDIEQDLALDLLQRLPAYDSSRASVATFADRVIGNRVFTLTRPTARLKAERRMISLDVASRGKDGDSPLLDTFEVVGPPYFEPPWLREDKAALRIDVSAFVCSLPLPLRHLSLLLVSSGVADAAKETGLHRSTIYDQIRRLAERAEAAGLRTYLESTRRISSSADRRWGRPA
jgi:hypothetical protein